MSACSDFAEHVWKPGSCKNCFHPLSAHNTVGVLDGSVPAACLKNNLGGDEEVGLTALSSYSKPTIAVKPTMMSLDISEPKDINMNIEQQDNTKSPAERMGLKKLLNMSPLYNDNNGCNKAHRNTVLQSPEAKIDYNNCLSLSPSILPKDSMIISNILVSQEEGKGSQNLKKNANEDSCWQHKNMVANRNNGTHNGSGVKNFKESCEAAEDVPLSVDTVPSDRATIHCNGLSSSPVKTTTSSSSVSHMSTSSVDITSLFSPVSLNSFPVLSKESSLSDSPSYCGSAGSLPGPDESVGRPELLQSPQSPITMGSLESTSFPPIVRANSEPIYAESTKKKSKPGNVPRTHPVSPNQTKQSQCSEFEPSGESQRATITVMAAHTEENNRTFYLCSPDSGVSTQCNFSPTACKNPSSPAFRWPSLNHSAPCLSKEASLPTNMYPKPQSSPPIPPKRSSRSLKLGTSSLSPSLSSPVPLPEFPKLGASHLTTSMSSPVPLPELPVFFLVSSREGQFSVPTDNTSASSEHFHKPLHHSSSWNCCIEEEEEEEEEKERKGIEKKKLAASPGTTSIVTGLVNGAAVWKEASDSNAHRSPPLMTQPGTAPPAGSNNGACQRETKGTGAKAEGKHNGSMLAKQSLHGGSSKMLEAGKGAAKNDLNPPPPPPKKLHRVSSKKSGSSVELNCCSQQGSVESQTSSLRSLGSTSLPTASTDNLAADSGSRDTTRMSCSPFPRIPLASAPGSPLPPSFSSLGSQPPPLPEKKLVNRTVSAPDSANGKPFVRAYPRLTFAGSETNVCRSTEASSRTSLPPSPVDPRPMFSSNESLECCHTPKGRTSRSRTLDEPLKTTQGRLGVHCRTSITVSSSPQLSAPFSTPEPGTVPSVGSSLQLQTLLSNIDSREGVYSKLGGLYAESLRRLALKCEDHFTLSQKNSFRFDESNWSLFRLTSNKPSCNAGDAVYYSAACALDPSNSYAVKICKSPSVDAKQGHLYGLSVQQSIPPHFNLQQDCGHFLACVPQSMLPSDEASRPSASSGSVQQADQERVVVITPDIPHQTTSDFVREWEVVHKTQPEVYERRVCFLLLQLCNGLEHLKEHGVTHRDLCLENLLLAPHQQRRQQAAAASGAAAGDAQRHLPRLLISNFAKAKRRSSEDATSTSGDPRIKRDHARLAPEIVSAAQYRKFDEFQTGILIYELLHQPNPFEVSPALREQDYHAEDLPPVPSVSLYSSGLQKLAQLLLQPDPIKRIHIQEAKRILQSLLWGPRRDLMEQQWERHRKGGGLVDSSRNESLLNWLDVKRALLMMKFAERSLEPERNAELEDWLCCQYFSSAHPLSLCHTAELLYSLK